MTEPWSRPFHWSWPRSIYEPRFVRPEIERRGDFRRLNFGPVQVAGGGGKRGLTVFVTCVGSRTHGFNLWRR